MAILHLVRHAPTPDTGKRLTGRLPGVSLTDRGKEAAGSVADHLAGRPIAAVYTSPVLRCRETARPIAARHGLEAIPYRSLTEVDYGSLAGRTLASLRRTRLWKQVHAAPSRVTFPGGESLPAVQARAVAACEELAATHADREIVLVSHGDVVALTLAWALGTPLDLYQRIAVDPGSISTVVVAPEGPPRVRSLNLVPR